MISYVLNGRPIPTARADSDRGADRVACRLGASSSATEGSPWVDDDEAEAWQALAAVLVRLPAALDGQLSRDAGISFFDYHVLAELMKAPNAALRLGDLARAVSASPSRLSRAMTRLEARGCVYRTTDPANKRYTLGRLTHVGRAQVRAAAPAHAEAIRSWVFDRLTSAEVGQLRRICVQIHEALPSPDPTSE